MKSKWIWCVVVVALLGVVSVTSGVAPAASAQAVTPCTTLFGRSMPIGTQLVAEDCAGLEALYNTTNGASWTDNTGWGPGGSVFITPCSMRGVTCETRELPSSGINNSFSIVVDLLLFGNNLDGQIPPELGAMFGLITLGLSANSLSGPIPASLGDQPDLRTVILSHNDLTGSIPPELGIPNLRTLELRNNLLTGSIPAELTSPETLVLSDNQLSGRYPTAISGGSRQVEIGNNGCITIDETVKTWSDASGALFWDEGAPCQAVDDLVVSNVDAPGIVDVFANDDMPFDIVDTVEIVEAPTTGTTTVAGNQISYTPAGGSDTADSFRYESCSGIVCTSAAVAVTIIPPLCDGLLATIWGTSATETITGTAGPDVIWGGPGNDTIFGESGSDVLCGEGGDDIIFGAAGNDVILGSDGNDTLDGGDGLDLLRGGPGVDALDGGSGADRLLGGINNDRLIGGVGNDFLGGFGGNDTIEGGPGNDTIFGGFGGDTIDGGSGNDIIRGLIGDDRIDGGDGDDELFGDRGNDTINGQAGNDTIGGGNANDVLDGGSGDDSVSGGRADDTLSGGSGTDSCVGNKHIVGDTADATCEQKFGIP